MIITSLFAYGARCGVRINRIQEALLSGGGLERQGAQEIFFFCRVSSSLRKYVRLCVCMCIMYVRAFVCFM